MKDHLISFYARWLSPEGYLGLHLFIALMIAIFAGYFFAEIAEDVFFEGHAYLQVDVAARSVVEKVNGPVMTHLMKTITFAGNPLPVTLFSILIGLLLFYRHSRRRLYCFAAIMGGGAVLNLFLKDAFHRARPATPHLVSAGGYSFPSGHSMGSVLFFGGLAYVLFFSTERSTLERILAVVFCATAALLIGFSRIYLGVHYLSDVIAGYTAGLCWIGICIAGTETWVRLRDRRNSNRQGAKNPR
jgi:undecaprenyl-diphosphatase